MVRANKRQLITYGKKKGKTKKNNSIQCNFFITKQVKNVTVNNITNNYFVMNKSSSVDEFDILLKGPTYQDPKQVKNATLNNITNNYFVPNKSSSSDELDKLLKGPTYQDPKQSSITSLSREWQCFSLRQQTMSMYHSDVGSSDVSSVRLFKDPLKDSDAYSPSLLPSPPNYYDTKKNQKIKKIRPERKKANRIFKRKTKQNVKVIKQRSNDSNSGVRCLINTACSTPTSSHLLPPENAISPILPPASNNTSVQDIFDVEEETVSEIKEQSLGMSDLLNGMGRLGITTPYPKTKTLENNKHCSQDPAKEASPSGSTENIVKTSLALNKEADDCKTECNGEPSPEPDEKSSTLNKVSYYRPRSKINILEISPLNCVVEKTGRRDGCSKKICRSNKKSNIKENLNNSNSFTSIKEIEFFDKFFSDDSKGEESFIENKENLTSKSNMNDESKNEFSCSIKGLEVKNTSNNSAKDCKKTQEKSTSSDGNTSSTVHSSPPARYALRSKAEIGCSSPISKCVQYLTGNEEPTEETVRPYRLSLQPGKKWRRSLLQYKHRESKECTANIVPTKGRRSTVGPALLAKLIAANITLNSTRHSLNDTQMNIDKMLSKVDNSMSSFNISTNSILNNSAEMKRRVSMRSRRCPANRERRPFFVENNMDEITEESLFQLLENENPDLSKKKSLISSTKYTSTIELKRTIGENEDEQLNQSDFFAGILRTPINKFNNHSLNYTNSNFDESPGKNKIKSLASPKLYTSIAEAKKTLRRNEEQLNESETFEGVMRMPIQFKRESLHLQSHSPNHSISILETPPILKMNENVLNTITKRRRTRAYYRQSLLFLDISDEKDDEFQSSDDDSPTKESIFLYPDLPLLWKKEQAIAKLIENMDEDKHRLLKRAEVMIRCGQKTAVPFSEAFPDKDLAASIKIGEGVFGEVFLCQRKTGGTVVKIIPVEGSQLVNGEPQKLFDEVLSELIISEELSLLRDNLQFCTSGFCEVKNKFCVQGRYPSMLLDLWHKYDQKKKSDNDCPDMFGAEQLYIVLELDHVGEAVESFLFKSAKESYCVYLQTVFTLGVAEMAMDFEHRDLHLGNVLVKSTTETHISFTLNGDKFRLPTYGLKATIIDFSLSRMSVQNEVLCYDLEKDPELFTGSGDYQFELYRLMRADVQQNWREHVPKTNLRWLHYLVDKFITKCKYRNKKSKIHSEYLKKLEKHKQLILDFPGSFELSEFLADTYSDTLEIIERD